MTASAPSSAFAGFRFPREVITVAVRWYLRYGLSYRDVEELLCERGISVDHVTVYRWVQQFTAEFIEAARPCRRLPGDRWFVDETYVKLRPLDLPVSGGRSARSGHRRPALNTAGSACCQGIFARALAVGATPTEVTTDRAPAYPRVLDEYAPAALHDVEQYANNPIEADHGRLKAWLRPMRGLKRFRSAQTLAAGHAFIQNMRRGHYEIATDEPIHHRLRLALDALAAGL